MLFFLLEIIHLRQQYITHIATTIIIILQINGILLFSISLLESKAEAKGLLDAVGALEAFFTELLPEPEGLFSFLEEEAELFLAEEDDLLAEAELFFVDEAEAELFLAEEAEAELFLAEEAEAELFLAEEAEAELFLADEAEDGVFLEDPDFVDLLLSGCISSLHLVWSKFKVYPLSQVSHLLFSGHFKQWSIEVHLSSADNIIPILIDNKNINNLLYLFKENNILFLYIFNDIIFNIKLIFI